MPSRLIATAALLLFGFSTGPAASAGDGVPDLAGTTTFEIEGSGAADLHVPTSIDQLSIDFSETEVDSMVFVAARHTPEGRTTAFFVVVLPEESGGSVASRAVAEDWTTGGGIQLEPGAYTVYAAVTGGPSEGTTLTLTAQQLAGEVSVPLDRETNARVRMLDEGVPATNPSTFVYSGGGEDVVEADNGFAFVGGWAWSPAHAATESAACLYDGGAPALGYLPGCPGGSSIGLANLTPAAGRYRTRSMAWDLDVPTGSYALGYYTAQAVPADAVGIFGTWVDFD